MRKTSGERMTVMEMFEAENDRILRESQQADKEARAKVAEYEKKLGQAKDRREKAQKQFERMRDDFEHIEADTLESESRRISAAAIKREDVLTGAVSAEKYFQEGQDQAAIDAAARAETAKRLGQLLDAVRAKGLEVLKLEVEEAECEKQLVFLSTYPAYFMLERMRAQVKSLEASLVSNSSMMPIWTDLDTKKDALKRATGWAANGIAWRDLDLTAVKRMRFEAGLPDSELPKLLEIIAEMEGRPGSKVSLLFTSISAHGQNGLSVQVWR